MPTWCASTAACRCRLPLSRAAAVGRPSLLLRLALGSDARLCCRGLLALWLCTLQLVPLPVRGDPTCPPCCPGSRPTFTVRSFTLFPLHCRRSRGRASSSCPCCRCTSSSASGCVQGGSRRAGCNRQGAAAGHVCLAHVGKSASWAAANRHHACRCCCRCLAARLVRCAIGGARR